MYELSVVIKDHAICTLTPPQGDPIIVKAPTEMFVKANSIKKTTNKHLRNHPSHLKRSTNKHLKKQENKSLKVYIQISRGLIS